MNNEKGRGIPGLHHSFSVSLRSCLVCLEAVETENRATTLGFGAGLERNLAICTALGAGGGEHLPSLHALVLSLVAAVLAALRSGEAALSVESLLALREGETGAAVAACKLLISHTDKKKEVNCNLPSF